MDESATIADLEHRLAEMRVALHHSEEARGRAECALRERFGAEAALRESEARYHRLFETMNEGFVVGEFERDDQGKPINFRYLELNPALERLSGLKVEDTIGRWITEILPPDDARYWIEAFGSVLLSGVPARFEHRVAALDQWYSVNVTPYGPNLIATTYENITERIRMEERLRRTEKQQTFLLKLSDALRHLSDPIEVQEVASRMVGEHLKADRVAYSEVDGDELVVHRDYAPRAPSMVGRYPKTSFGRKIEGALASSGMVWVDDVQRSPELSDSERAAFQAANIASYLGSTLYKDGRFAGAFGLHQTTPRVWTEGEITLVEDVAERIWVAVTRARTEAALRESEERFAQFAASSSDALWIRDAATLAMEYVSPAIQDIYGLPPDSLIGDVRRWAGLILPEDRDVALSHLEQARQGEAVVHEFRIQRPSDSAYRWIRDTNFPLRDTHGRVQRIGGIAHDATDARLATEHSAVLLAELQHRVRNIMAMIRSITARTGERAASVPDYASLMAGRLMTLARVQALLTRGANVEVGLRSILEDELSAQAQHEAQYDLDGPDLLLKPKVAEVLTLAVHELTTNALKYGALSAADGRVHVSWATFERRDVLWLGFDWVEEGAPVRAPPDPSAARPRGFGSELIEGRIPYELKGRGTVTIEAGGARCHLEFPLQDGASILETGAPQRAAVFGGALDMNGEADLSGHLILVIEDDYYLATDTARALRGAGAEVLGPCASEESAEDEIARATPTAAVVDINLGYGPLFTVARSLKGRGVPFVLITGYDDAVIPSEFDEVARLQKPVDLRQIVGAVARAVAAMGLPDG